jgi:hypothetical protein
MPDRIHPDSILALTPVEEKLVAQARLAIHEYRQVLALEYTME